MYPAVAVFKRMDKDKSEGENCGCYHGVKFRGFLAVKGYHACNQLWEVLISCADMVWQRSGGAPVSFADKSSFSAQSKFDEAGIANDNLLQSQKLIEVNWRAACLTDSPSPSLNPILWRIFTFDEVTGARIFQQQERRRSCQ